MQFITESIEKIYADKFQYFCIIYMILFITYSGGSTHTIHYLEDVEERPWVNSYIDNHKHVEVDQDLCKEKEAEKTDWVHIHINVIRSLIQTVGCVFNSIELVNDKDWYKTFVRRQEWSSFGAHWGNSQSMEIKTPILIWCKVYLWQQGSLDDRRQTRRVEQY
jgi:hypothetical protein